jgi:hypothetical protein
MTMRVISAPRATPPKLLKVRDAADRWTALAEDLAARPSRQRSMIMRALNILTLLILATLATGASAQGRTFYGADGKAAARSTTDTQGTTTLYGADGKVISRETNTRSGSTVYDGASGHVVGKVTKEKR